MGLSFLNKKTWHPGSFANIEKVWIAEQKQRELERKQIENQKKLKEERQIEELKKMQVEAGLIPASHLQRLDWIYQAPECTSNISTAEEFLLGKPLKDEKPEEKRHFTPVFQESYSNPQNEVFTKIHEDPLFVMKREEMKSRKEIEENPYRMKMIMKEIEDNLIKQKKDKKDKKKDKKEKKHKKSKHRSKSRSSSSSYKKDKKSSHKSKDHNIVTPSLLKYKLLDSSSTKSFGLIDKDGKQLEVCYKKSLGPDESLYRERNEQMKRDSSRKQRSTTGSYKSLSDSEKEKIRQDMENKARQYDVDKVKKFESATKNNIESSLNNLQLLSKSSSSSTHSNISVLNKPGFLKSIEKDVYTSGSMNLEERVRRNKVNMKKDKY